ncbi:MAG: hypothetical protein GY696_29190 [Gammaproteobacteria bacterium]|nr:hypothetical protein [Gammaproteobacteria bacterium]
MKGLCIPKFQGDDFHSWKKSAEGLLKLNGVWRIITGDQPAPAEDASEEVKSKHLNLEDKAFGLILLSLDDKPRSVVQDSATTAKGIWDKLVEHYSPKSFQVRCFLTTKLVNLKLAEGGDLGEHLKQMRMLHQQFSAAGYERDEQEQVVFLLNSLPPSYGTFFTAITASVKDDAELTWEYVTQKLLNEEQKRQEEGKSTGGVNNSAFFSHKGSDSKRDPKQQSQGFNPRGTGRGGRSFRGSGRSGFNNNANRGIQCYGCNGFGHIKRDCPKGRGGSRANFAHGHTALSAHAYASLSKSTAVYSGKWCIDSGATDHYACRTDCMLDYKSFDSPSVVHIGNGAPLTAYGKGSVFFNLHGHVWVKLFSIMMCGMYQR